jgi:hypothetical protein
LGKKGQSPCKVAATEGDDITPREAHLTLRWFFQTDKEPHERALAGAIGTNQSGNPAASNMAGNVIENLSTTCDKRKVVTGQGGCSVDFRYRFP